MRACCPARSAVSGGKRDPRAHVPGYATFTATSPLRSTSADQAVRDPGRRTPWGSETQWRVGAAGATGHPVHIDGKSHMVIRHGEPSRRDISSLAARWWLALGRRLLAIRQIWRLDAKSAPCSRSADPSRASRSSIAWGPHGVYESRQRTISSIGWTRDAQGHSDATVTGRLHGPSPSTRPRTGQSGARRLKGTSRSSTRHVGARRARSSSSRRWHPGGAYGTVITKNRVFKSDGERRVLYSFPLDEPRRSQVVAAFRRSRSASERAGRPVTRSTSPVTTSASPRAMAV